MGDLDEKNCKNCKEYRRGDCLGRELCEFYEPAPSEKKEYWPKTMRSRYSYAGSEASDRYITGLGNQKAPEKQGNKSIGKERGGIESTALAKNSVKKELTVNKSSSWKSQWMASENEYKHERYSRPDKVERILRKCKGKFLIWVSIETLQNGTECKYLSKCLLLLDHNWLLAESGISDKSENHAMRRAIIMAIEHIKRSCDVYIVVDRDILFGFNSIQPYYRDDLLDKIFRAFREHGCNITEIEIQNGTNMIRNQVANPVYIED